MNIDEQLRLVKELISLNKTQTEICNVLDISKSTYWRRINELGLKSNRSRYGSLLPLLQDIPEAWYWVGFLLADGCFTTNSKNNKYKSLRLELSVQDENHLLKFKNFVHSSHKIYRRLDGISSVLLAIADHKNIDTLMDKFDIKIKKTWNPPTNLKLDNIDLGLALITGFIDGDGCIYIHKRTKNVYLKIVCHKSWKNVFNMFASFLEPIIDSMPKLQTVGNYTHFNIYKQKSLIKLKNRVLQLNIPILNRKWDFIDPEAVEDAQQE